MSKAAACALVLVFMAGCGGAGEEPEQAAGPACTPVEQTLLDYIATEAGTLAGLTLRDGQAAPLPARFNEKPQPQTYVIAAEVDGPGYEGDGHVGTWVAGGQPTAADLGGLVAGNELARQVTEWGSVITPGSPADVKRNDALAEAGAAAEACD